MFCVPMQLVNVWIDTLVLNTALSEALVSVIFGTYMRSECTI